MASKKTWLLRGLRDGLPIGIGYFAVSFALGISAVANGINPAEAGIMSILNLTSAGEAAAIYANYVAVRPEDENAEWVEALRSCLCSEKVYEFMTDNEDYAGGVIPYFSLDDGEEE